MTEERYIDWTKAKQRIEQDSTSLFIKGFMSRPEEAYIPGRENADLRLMLFAGYGHSLADFVENDPLMSQMSTRLFKECLADVDAAVQRIVQSPDHTKAFALGAELAMKRIDDANKFYKGDTDLLHGFIYYNNLETFNLYTPGMI